MLVNSTALRVASQTWDSGAVRRFSVQFSTPVALIATGGCLGAILNAF
jgi:hypothetical protein